MIFSPLLSAANTASIPPASPEAWFIDGIGGGGGGPGGGGPGGGGVGAEGAPVGARGVEAEGEPEGDMRLAKLVASSPCKKYGELVPF